MKNWILVLDHLNLESVAENLKEILITQDSTFGRWPNSDVYIPTKYTSRRKAQCKILHHPDYLEVISYDVGGVNPTTIDHERIPPDVAHRLPEGSILGIGVTHKTDDASFLYKVTKRQIIPIIKTETKEEEEKENNVVLVEDSDEERLHSWWYAYKEEPPSLIKPSTGAKESDVSKRTDTTSSKIQSTSTNIVEKKIDEEIDKSLTSNKNEAAEITKHSLSPSVKSSSMRDQSRSNHDKSASKECKDNMKPLIKSTQSNPINSKFMFIDPGPSTSRMVDLSESDSDFEETIEKHSLNCQNKSSKNSTTDFSDVKTTKVILEKSSKNSTADFIDMKKTTKALQSDVSKRTDITSSKIQSTSTNIIEKKIDKEVNKSLTFDRNETKIAKHSLSPSVKSSSMRDQSRSNYDKSASKECKDNMKPLIKSTQSNTINNKFMFIDPGPSTSRMVDLSESDSDFEETIEKHSLNSQNKSSKNSTAGFSHVKKTINILPEKSSKNSTADISDVPKTAKILKEKLKRGKTKISITDSLSDDSDFEKTSTNLTAQSSQKLPSMNGTEDFSNSDSDLEESSKILPTESPKKAGKGKRSYNISSDESSSDNTVARREKKRQRKLRRLCKPCHVVLRRLTAKEIYPKTKRQGKKHKRIISFSDSSEEEERQQSPERKPSTSSTKYAKEKKISLTDDEFQHKKLKVDKKLELNTTEDKSAEYKKVEVKHKGENGKTAEDKKQNDKAAEDRRNVMSEEHKKSEVNNTENKQNDKTAEHKRQNVNFEKHKKSEIKITENKKQNDRKKDKETTKHKKSDVRTVEEKKRKSIDENKPEESLKKRKMEIISPPESPPQFIMEIKQEPEDLPEWDDSQYTLDEDDDIVIVKEIYKVKRDSCSEDETSIIERPLDDEFNFFLSSQRHEDSSEQTPSAACLGIDFYSTDAIEKESSSEEEKEDELHAEKSVDEHEESEQEAISDQEDVSEQEDISELSAEDETQQKRPEGTVLIEPLPMYKRKRGRSVQTSTPKSLNEKSNELSKISSRTSAELRMSKGQMLKPKPTFTDKIRSLKGQKINKNCNWITGYNAVDKEEKQAVKDQRKLRLKQLEMNKVSERHELYNELKSSIEEPKPSTSYETTIESVRNEGPIIGKIPVKNTRKNRSAFLAEPMQHISRKQTTTIESIQKIVLDSKVIIVPPEDSKKVMKNSSGVSESLKGEANKVSSRKKVVDDCKKFKASPETVSSTSQNTFSSPKESIVPGETKSSSDKFSVSPVTPQSPKQKSSPSLAKHSKHAYLDNRVPQESTQKNRLLSKKIEPSTYLVDTPSPKEADHPIIPADVPLRSCLKVRTREKDDERKIHFNLEHVVETFFLEHNRCMKQVDANSSLQRNPLPDIESDKDVAEQIERVIYSILYWSSKWINQHQPSSCPPVWRQGLLQYTETEFKAIKPASKVLFPIEDQSKWKEEPLPESATSILRYKSYEKYQKIWLRLMLLEMWSSLYVSFMENQTKLEGELCNWRLGMLETLPRSWTVHFTALLTKDMTVSIPKFGDIVVVTFLNNKDANEGYRNFGFIEMWRLTEEPENGKIRLDDKTGRPIVATLELDIKIRYRNDGCKSYKAHVQLLHHCSSLLKSMQGLFELKSSTLCNTILSPTLKNMKCEKSDNTMLFFPTLREMMGDMTISENQELICNRIVHTLRSDKPSLSVIEGPPGTGKTRTLQAIVMRLLEEFMYPAPGNKPYCVNGATAMSRLGTRILVCVANNDALNAFAHMLDYRLDKNRPHQKFKWVVVGTETELSSSAAIHSLQAQARNRISRSMDYDIDFDWVEAPNADVDMNLIENLIESKVHCMNMELEHARLCKRQDVKQLEEKLRLYSSRLEKLKSRELDPKEVTTSSMRFENHLKKILQHAQVILTTVKGLTTTMLSTAFYSRGSQQIPICLIDDAQSYSEFQTLMPLAYGARKLVLCGDLSLPPSVMKCKLASDSLGLNQSLLLRISKSLDSILGQGQPSKFKYFYLRNSHKLQNVSYHILRQQVRMHPGITRLVAKYYQDGAMWMPERTKDHCLWPFKPFLVLDHDFNLQFRMTPEHCLEYEADLIVRVVRCIQEYQYKLKQQIPDPSQRHGTTQVMVVTLSDFVRKRLDHKFQKIRRPPSCVDWTRTLETSTLDASVVVLSVGCIEPDDSNAMKLSYFLQAITRAKQSLIIVGSMLHFARTKHWKILLEMADKCNVHLRIRDTIMSMDKCQELVLSKHLMHQNAPRMHRDPRQRQSSSHVQTGPIDDEWIPPNPLQSFLHVGVPKC